MIWLDAARVLSIVAVVVLHVAGSVVTLAPLGSSAWWAGNLYDSLVRWCVPVFVMVSGALLLDPRKTEGLGGFYRKRAARVLLPIAFWSVVYILWNHRGDLGALRAIDVLHSVARGWPHYHLWFLYMIVCLYLFVPFLRTLVLHTARRDLWWLVALMFVLSGVNELYRVFSGNPAGLFINWFLSYLPYFLCGYLIQSSDKKPPIAALAAVFAVTAAVTALGCYGLGGAQGLDRGLYFYGYLSLSVIPMSISLMLMFRQCRWEGLLGRVVQWASPLTLGVYLVHPILLESLREYGFQPENRVPLLSVPVVALVVLGGSLLVALCFHRVPGLKRLI